MQRQERYPVNLIAMIDDEQVVVRNISENGFYVEACANTFNQGKVKFAIYSTLGNRSCSLNGDAIIVWSVISATMIGMGLKIIQSSLNII